MKVRQSSSFSTIIDSRLPRDITWESAPGNWKLVSTPLSPFHEQINPAIGDRSEPQSLLEPERRIEAFDVDARRLAGGRRL
jgi:hypothetical protein